MHLILFVLAALVCLAAVGVTVNLMLQTSCPACLEETGEHEPVWPVGFGLLWWCMSCQRFWTRGQVVKRDPS